MKKYLGTGLAALLLGSIALTGCANTGGTGSATATTSVTGTPSASPSASSPSASATKTSSTATPASAAELMTAESSKGTIVVDGKGMSVYYYTKDVKDSGTSACTGGCLTAWPPVTTTSATPSVDGVTGTVGTITTPEGTKQITINGMPIYYYAKDMAAGDILGQDVNDVWYLVDPAGEMITD